MSIVMRTKPYEAHNLSVCSALHDTLQFCRFDKVEAGPRSAIGRAPDS